MHPFKGWFLMVICSTLFIFMTIRFCFITHNSFFMRAKCNIFLFNEECKKVILQLKYNDEDDDDGEKVMGLFAYSMNDHHTVHESCHDDAESELIFTEGCCSLVREKSPYCKLWKL